MADVAGEEVEEHEHDYRRNPFVIYQQGTVQSEEVACADPKCPARYLRPLVGHPLSPQSWPKA
jgi:hypothetical protein